jgi:hypothetical protein
VAKKKKAKGLMATVTEPIMAAGEYIVEHMPMMGSKPAKKKKKAAKKAPAKAAAPKAAPAKKPAKKKAAKKKK